ncbi:MAG: type II CAAX endopeptidase family protein [Bacteroidaceae bacterium]
MTHGIYSYRPIWQQITVLLLTLIVCIFLAAIPFSILNLFASNPLDPAILRASILIQDLFLFILFPIVSQLLLCKDSLADSFSLHKYSTFSIVIGILSIICISPFIDLSVQWNETLQLPPALHGMQQWMEASEAEATKTINLILNDPRISVFCVNFFIIAILAGIGEELFFRGLLQHLLIRWTNGKIHLAIWIVAFLFSAIHLQFFGFIPRMLLGALLGYLCFYSGSLWTCIIAHAFNNGLTLLLMPNQPYNENLFSSPELLNTVENTKASPTLAICSLIGTLLLVAWLKFKNQKIK